LDGGLKILEDMPTVSPGLGQLEPENILLPGIVGPGSFTTTVSGEVAPSATAQRYDVHAASARAHAAADTVIATGKASVPSGEKQFTLTLKPTAAAKTLLAANHPELELKATVTFKPSDEHHTYTKTVTKTLPAGE
jgi:hypothetical protein